MKKYITIFLAIILFPCFVNAFDVSISYRSSFPSSTDLSTVGGIELGINHEGYLGWLAYEDTMLRYVGQEALDLTLLSAGIGYEIEIVKNLTVTIKGGYYMPIKSYRNTYQEAIYRQMYAYTYPIEGWKPDGDIHYIEETCDYEINGNLGGMVHVNWIMSITSWFNIDMLAGWRYLNLKDRISADIEGLYPGAYHEFTTNRCWSGGVLGIAIVFKF